MNELSTVVEPLGRGDQRKKWPNRSKLREIAAGEEPRMECSPGRWSCEVGSEDLGPRANERRASAECVRCDRRRRRGGCRHYSAAGLGSESDPFRANGPIPGPSGPLIVLASFFVLLPLLLSLDQRGAVVGMCACSAGLLRGGSFAIAGPATGLSGGGVLRRRRLQGSHRTRAAASMSSSVAGGLDQEASRHDIGGFLARRSYEPPAWASQLSPVPSLTYNLGHVSIVLLPAAFLPAGSDLLPRRILFLSRDECSSCLLFRQFPTPIHKWNLPDLPEGTEVWIKVGSRFPILFVLWGESLDFSGFFWLYVDKMPSDIISGTISRGCSWAGTKCGNWNSFWPTPWHRALTALSPSGVYRATIVVRRLSPQDTWTSTRTWYYARRRSSSFLSIIST